MEAQKVTPSQIRPSGLEQARSVVALSDAARLGGEGAS